MLKKKRSFEKAIVPLIKPKLQAIGRWSEWRKRMYDRHKAHEEGMRELIKKRVESHPVWQNWLSKLNGIDLALAAQIIGGFKSALSPGETLGKTFIIPAKWLPLLV